MRSNGDKRTGKSLAELTTSTRRAKSWTARVVTGAVALATLAGVIHTASAASTADPASTYAGTHLTVQQAAQFAYTAGFHSENSLLAVVAIGIAESGLVSQTRNWHPEYGYRPAADDITVQGPTSVWNGNQQMQSDRGAWQISSHWWPQYTDAQTDNPATAAKLMFSISHNGTDFSPWDTYQSGAAQKYYDGAQNGFPALRPIVDQVIAAGGGTAAPVAAPKVVTSPNAIVNSAPTTTAKVAAKPTATPTVAKPAAAAPNVATGNEIRHPGTYTTAYDYQDNTPSNSSAISNPVIHSQAGGTGTYADPITVAVDHLSGGQLQFPKGTRFYVPNIRAYLIAEDTTGETAPGTIHLDMWAGGQTSSQSSAYDCMSHVTGHYLVIENPASNYTVVPGPLAANNACRQLFGDSVATTAPVTVTPPPITNKQPVTTTTKKAPVTTTTKKKPVTTTTKPKVTTTTKPKVTTTTKPKPVTNVVKVTTTTKPKPVTNVIPPPLPVYAPPVAPVQDPARISAPTQHRRHHHHWHTDVSPAVASHLRSLCSGGSAS